MGIKEAQRLRELEKENSELKKLMADQMLKSKALEIALGKNSESDADAGQKEAVGNRDCEDVQTLPLLWLAQDHAQAG